MTSSLAFSSSAESSHPALPPDVSGLRPDRLPPVPSGLGFTSPHVIDTAQAPAEPVTFDVTAQSHRKATGLPEATSHDVKSPRRHLDPELARAIKEAKLKTGASWRRVAKFTGLSNSYLVQLSNGQRVPSRETVELLVDVLPIEEWAVEGLRSLAD